MGTIDFQSDSRKELETTLVVGLGSAHGDDCLGWMILEKLRTLLPAAFQLNCLASPVDLLDHLNGIRLLHIIDACRLSSCQSVEGSQESVPTRMLRIEWPSSAMPSYRWTSSHSIPLPAVLELASRLKILPQKVTIWGVIGSQFDSGSEPSYLAAGWIEKWARQVQCELVGRNCRQELP